MDVLICAGVGATLTYAVVLACDAFVWVGRQIEADRVRTRLQEQTRKMRGLSL